MSNRNTGELPPDISGETQTTNKGGADSVQAREIEGKSVKLLFVEDQHTERAMGIFNKSLEEDLEEQDSVDILPSKDLSSALQQLENLPEGARSVVMTDMLFPEKTGSMDKSEGMKILQEICEHYGIDYQAIVELLFKPEDVKKKRELYEENLKVYEKLRAVYIEAWEILERSDVDVSELSHLRGRNDAQGMFDFFRRVDFLDRPSNAEDGRRLRSCEMKIYGLDEDTYYKMAGQYNKSVDSEQWDQIEKLLPAKVLKQFEDDKGQSSFPEAFRDLLHVLQKTDPAEQPLGMRVAEKAYEQGLPVLLITSHHTEGQKFARNILPHYLKEKGVLESDEVINDKVIDDEGTELNELVKTSSIFVMGKGANFSKSEKMWPALFRESIDRAVQK